jgi:hypothetical protein
VIAVVVPIESVPVAAVAPAAVIPVKVVPLLLLPNTFSRLPVHSRSGKNTPASVLL